MGQEMTIGTSVNKSLSPELITWMLEGFTVCSKPLCVLDSCVHVFALYSNDMGKGLL